MFGAPAGSGGRVTDDHVSPQLERLRPWPMAWIAERSNARRKPVRSGRSPVRLAMLSRPGWAHAWLIDAFAPSEGTEPGRDSAGLPVATDALQSAATGLHTGVSDDAHPTRGPSVVLTVLLVVTGPAGGARPELAAVPRRAGGVAADDPKLPDTWSTTENVAWKIDIPGRSWSSPVVWGDHVFVVSAINTRQPSQPLNAVGDYLARSLGGPMTGNDISQPTDEHRWVLYDVDFQTGKIRWERTINAAVPLQAVHQKNSLRL